VPFREESCRSSCIYSGLLHIYSRDAVSQHPSTRAGAESIQLIYSGRALQALSDSLGNFGVTPFFGGNLKYPNSSMMQPKKLILVLLIQVCNKRLLKTMKKHMLVTFTSLVLER